MLFLTEPTLAWASVRDLNPRPLRECSPRSIRCMVSAAARSLRGQRRCLSTPTLLGVVHAASAAVGDPGIEPADMKLVIQNHARVHTGLLARKGQRRGALGHVALPTELTLTGASMRGSNPRHPCSPSSIRCSGRARNRTEPTCSAWFTAPPRSIRVYSPKTASPWARCIPLDEPSVCARCSRTEVPKSVPLRARPKLRLAGASHPKRRCFLVMKMPNKGCELNSVDGGANRLFVQRFAPHRVYRVLRDVN